jgi:hypothetical protein
MYIPYLYYQSLVSYFAAANISVGFGPSRGVGSNGTVIGRFPYLFRCFPEAGLEKSLV